MRQWEEIQKVSRDLTVARVVMPPRSKPPSRRVDVSRRSRNPESDLTNCKRELRYFLETGRVLTSTRDPRTALRLILEKIRGMVRCEAWALLLVDPETQELVFEMVGGARARRLKGLRIQSGQGLVGWVARYREPLLVPDTRKDKRFMENIDRATASPTRTILCLPLISNRRPVGVLEMLNKTGRPFDRADLKLLTHLLEQVSLSVERVTLYEKMASLGIIDELTKLFNARYLEQTLDREVRRCRRYESIMALIFLDLDYFKLINDHHGHPMGSRCLAEVAKIMVKSVRDVDILARYGGDEFVVILPETTVATAQTVAERLIEAVRAHVFLKEEGIKAHITASLGVAGFPDHAQTKEDLIRKADEAMYRAKAAGRNRIRTVDQR